MPKSQARHHLRLLHAISGSYIFKLLMKSIAFMLSQCSITNKDDLFLKKENCIYMSDALR